MSENDRPSSAIFQCEVRKTSDSIILQVSMGEDFRPQNSEAWDKLVLNVTPILIDCAKSKVLPCMEQIVLKYCPDGEPIRTETYFPAGTLPEELV